MAFGDKPSEYPEWASGGGAEIDEPLLAAKQLGYVDSAVPDAGNLNWWMNTVYLWAGYLGNFEAADHTWAGHHIFTGIVEHTPSTAVAFTFNTNSRPTMLGIMYVGDGVASNARITVRGGAFITIGSEHGAGSPSNAALNIGGGTSAGAGNLNVQNNGTVDLLSGSTFKVESGAVFELLNGKIDASLGVIRIGGPATGNGFLTPDSGTLTHYAAFDSSNRWMASDGFYSPSNIVSDQSVEAGHAGFLYTSSLERYYIVSAHQFAGNKSTQADVDGNGEPTVLISASYTGGVDALTARAHLPEGAQVDKIDILIQNTNGSAKTLAYRHVQMTVNDETSDFTINWFNTSGGSLTYDSITVAGSAALAWVSLPQVGVATAQSNGLIEVTIRPTATGASTGLIIKAIRFRYAQPRVGSSF